MEEEVLRKLMGQLMPKVTTQLRSAMANMHFASAALAPEDQRTADPELDRKAAYLDQSYYQLLRLVNNLALADLLTSQRELALRDRDLAALLREACLRAESLATLKGLELEFRCPRDPMSAPLTGTPWSSCCSSCCPTPLNSPRQAERSP